MAKLFDFLYQTDEEFTLRPLMQEISADGIKVEAGSAERRNKAELLQCITLYIFCEVAFYTSMPECFGEFCSLILQVSRLILTKAIKKPQNRCRLCYDAGRCNHAVDIDAAIQYGEAGQFLLHDLTRAKYIQDWDDQSVFSCCAPGKPDSLRDAVILYTDQHDIRAVRVFLHGAGLYGLEMDIPAM